MHYNNNRLGFHGGGSPPSHPYNNLKGSQHYYGEQDEEYGGGES
jgi:hypothetical protein